MIDAKHFRIGNLILIDNKPCRINLVNNDPAFSETPCIGYDSKGDTGYERCSSDRVQPAPVTELDMRNFDIKFGNQIKLAYHKSDPTIFTMNFTNSDDHSGNNLHAEIRHIHVLQNLYFALCGEEMP
jgi:hypothetical protein